MRGYPLERFWDVLTQGAWQPECAQLEAFTLGTAHQPVMPSTAKNLGSL